ncbi:MAG: Rieske 2Fe-2S domain-containing protein [Alphaproteobacteria bacterium]|nr:Rieske 2Fe-2S domain-containing protein [Alphaproteobacteria bacterium]
MSVEFLRNLWYFATPSRALRNKQLVHKLLLGEPVVLGRTETGEPFALRDLCPHRAVPLSAGRVVEGTIECPYHGWRFKPSGQCAAIPSLVGEEGVDPSKIHVRRYPLVERNGLIWIYMAQDPVTDTNPVIDVPELPIAADAMPRMIEAQLFPCEIDHAVMGLMDPAHGPFVHKVWWWRSAKSIHAKAKKYAPIPRGFTMVSHKPSSNSLLYNVLGGDVSTEISFELPSVRVEHIKAGKHEVVGLTTCTPITEQQTEVTQTFYWTMNWVAPFKPIFRQAALTFLNQDREMVALQAQGLKFNPRLMLIQDADVPAMWYHRLKKEWTASRSEGRQFVNPVPETTLHWRS